MPPDPNDPQLPPTGDPPASSPPTSDAEHWERQAKLAFAERDKAKQRLRELEPKLLTDDQLADYEKLKTQAVKLEEQRKRAEGRFDEMRAELVRRHEGDLRQRDEKIDELSKYIEDTAIDQAFLAATDWFGGESAKTVLTPAIATAYLRRYVSMDDVTVGNGKQRVPVVHWPDGRVITDRNGNPAPFVDAIGELIEQHPDKDRILRGSGKAGSGSSGGTGSGGRPEIDVEHLTAKDFRDPNVRAAVKAHQQKAGGIVFGPAFERARNARS